MMAARVETRAGLNAAEHAAVVRLQRECESAQGLDLKLELARADTSTSDNTLLAYAHDSLVGYCGIDAGPDAEVCGMVHPQHRRHGTGTALLDGVLALAAGAGHDSILTICEDASPVAMAWLRRRGATLHQSEQRMVLSLGTAHAAEGAAMRLRHASPDDRPELVRLLSDAFDETPDSVGARLDRGMSAPGEETLIAYQGDTAVATTRLDTTTRRTMIYGFVVDRALRGQGHGRSMMRSVLNLLHERQVAEVGLEVDPENVAAVRLYQGFGFKAITTYRYLQLPAAPLRRA